MRKFLWDFTFEELFLKEKDSEILERASEKELENIECLADFFDRTAEKCQLKVQQLDCKQFYNCISQFQKADLKLQLCLIYSLSEIWIRLDKEQILFFIENQNRKHCLKYRLFREKYHFEKYVLLNQILPAP